MKHRLTAILTALTLSLTASIASAHTIYDDNQTTKKQAEATIKKLDAYMSKHYNITLTDDMTIINTRNYKNDLKKYNLQDYGYAVEHSAAVSVPARNIIIINVGTVTKKSYNFFLTHELVHKYQSLKAKQKNTTMDNHAGLLEGIADKIAENVTGIRLSADDQKIPFDNLKSAKELKAANIFYGDVKVYEQCRYYAEKFMKENPKKLFAD